MTRASMSVLSKDDIQQVHDTSLRILAEVGVKIDSPKILEMARSNGVKIYSGKGLAFLDESTIKNALKTAPKKIKICSRGGKDYTIPEEGVQLLSTDGQPPAVYDAATKKKRPSKLKDLINICILADALPDVDFVWPSVIATDMPPNKSSMFEFLAAIAYTSKHIQHGAASEEEASFQIEIASAILGSNEELRRRPIISDVCTPISPLRYDQGEAEALVILSRAGVPMVHLSMGIAGSATPVSIAGTLAVINAENLFGLTLTQIARPGAPSIYSSFSGVMDMKSGVFLCGTPEAILIDSAATQMSMHYGLPSCAGGPANASKTISAEAGYQSAMTAMGAVLTGADLMVGLGNLDRAGMIGPEKLVMDCEVWRWLKRLRAGVSVSKELLAFDAIKRQGPGGAFLSDPHTLKYMRKDLIMPQVTAYHPGGEPDFGRDDMLEYAKKKVKEILSTYKPPLLSRDIADRVGTVAKKYGIVKPDGAQIFEHA